MFGKLARQHEQHRCLDLSRAQRALLIVPHELAGLVDNFVEDVTDEGVHDAHALGRDARVGVDLLEHLVDVDAVAFAAALLLALLLLALSLGLLLLGGLLLLSFWRHSSETHFAVVVDTGCQTGKVNAQTYCPFVFSPPPPSRSSPLVTSATSTLLTVQAVLLRDRNTFNFST